MAPDDRQHRGIHKQDHRKHGGTGFISLFSMLNELLQVTVPFHPSVFLANSHTASCIPRQTPAERIVW